MTTEAPAKLLLANPRGFCAGVERAIDAIDRLLDEHGAPLYVRREIVHNRDVIDGFRKRGVIFVDELDQVPDGALAVFSAHGVSPEVQRNARDRGLRVIDATCPLVTKVHLEVLRFVKEGLYLIFIGHGEHDEAIGTLGHAPGNIALVENARQAETVQVPDPDRLAVVTQTTLSLDDTEEIINVLKRRFPNIREPARSDICYATQNRQVAVKALAPEADVVVVVGSDNSSNSQRLKDAAVAAGTPAYLVDAEDQLKAEWFAGASKVAVTAGASSPESLVQRIVTRIRELHNSTETEEFGEPEPAIVFTPPREMVDII